MLHRMLNPGLACSGAWHGGRHDATRTESSGKWCSTKRDDGTTSAATDISATAAAAERRTPARTELQGVYHAKKSRARCLLHRACVYLRYSCCCNCSGPPRRSNVIGACRSAVRADYGPELCRWPNHRQRSTRPCFFLAWTQQMLRLHVFVRTVFRDILSLLTAPRLLRVPPSKRFSKTLAHSYKRSATPKPFPAAQRESCTSPARMNRLRWPRWLWRLLWTSVQTQMRSSSKQSGVCSSDLQPNQLRQLRCQWS